MQMSEIIQKLRTYNKDQQRYTTSDLSKAFEILQD